MPELPEVETIKLQLNTVLPGLVIKKIEILSPKNFVGNKKTVIGKKIKGLRRFGKMLVIDTEGKESLAIHLKMTGRLIYRGKKQPKNLQVQDPKIQKLPSLHTRIIIYFTNGDTLYFNDLRKFGWIKVLDVSSIKYQVSRLGIEPFTKEFTLENFQKVVSLSNKPVKLLLMDQEKIAGVGNIYANDALFAARIHPKSPARKLNPEEVGLLYNKISEILKKAIKWKGASDDAYVDAFGEKGEVQEHFLVYARNKEKCLNNCGSTIKKIKLGGRGTFYCPNCQPL